MESFPWIKQSKLENPSTTMGVIGRMLLEVLFFRSLFQEHKDRIQGRPEAFVRV